MKEWGKAIKKLSIVKKVNIALLSIVIVGSGILWYNDISLAPFHEGNKRTVDYFLTNMSNEDYQRAYSMFSDKYKGEEDFETFEKNASGFKKVYGNYNENSFTVNNVTRHFQLLSPQTLEYTGEITYGSGEKATVTAIFIWENDDWRLYVINVT
jgi:hypothetical protein